MAESRTGSLPPLEWLRAFEAAGRLGSFTAAATETGLTQAAVSQRIKLLEQRLEARLFRRLPRGVELTADGDAYLPHISDALERMRRGTADLFVPPKNRIAIVAPASVSALWLAPRLAAAPKTIPGLEISLASIHREADYTIADYDYHIRFGQGIWAGFQSAMLYRERLVPVCAPALREKAAGKDWSHLPVIAVKGLRDGWREWSGFSGDRLPAAPALRFDSQIAAIEAAEAGAGVMLASLPLCEQRLADRRLVRLSQKTLTMAAGMWLVWQDDAIHAGAHRSICETLGIAY